MTTPLIDALENASDEEIVSTGKRMTKLFTNKILIGIVVSVVVHFASDAIVHAIEGRKQDSEESE